MTLPPRIPKKEKRASRWKSTAHRNWVRGFACCNCGSTTNIEVAHVRMGSGAGMGQKPDDWRTTPLCHDCHDAQHGFGEPGFWDSYKRQTGQSVEDLIAALSKASPKAREIAQVQRERENV